MSRLRGEDVNKAEQLILQEAMLRSSVLRMSMRAEFKEELKRRLAHGTYYDTDWDGCGDNDCSGIKGLFRRIVSKLSKLKLPALARYGGFCAVYVCPIVLVLAISPMVGKDTNLSAIAAEIQRNFGSKSSISYQVTDIYENTRTGFRSAILWKVWKASGGYAYVERCDGDRPGVRLTRSYYSPDKSVYIDDRGRQVRITNYHGRINEAERKVQDELAAPIGLGTDLPVAASFTRRPVTLQDTGRQVMSGYICKAYTDGSGLNVWVDATGLGYLKVRDTTGATFEPEIETAAGGDVIHTIEVKDVSRNDLTPDALFVPNPPDGYSLVEVRDVYTNLDLPKNSLCFTPNIPKKLWQVFERPKTYTLVTGGSDSQLQVVLFKRNEYKDVYGSLILTQYRKAPLMTPVNGSVNDPDSKTFLTVPKGLEGVEYSWTTGATDFAVMARSPGEHTVPDVNYIWQAVKEMAPHLSGI